MGAGRVTAAKHLTSPVTQKDIDRLPSSLLPREPRQMQPAHFEVGDYVVAQTNGWGWFPWFKTDWFGQVTAVSLTKAAVHWTADEKDNSKNVTTWTSFASKRLRKATSARIFRHRFTEVHQMKDRKVQ